MENNKLTPFQFVIAYENGTLTEDQFDASVQEFVDSNIWRDLQGSWQRDVQRWINYGLVSI